MEHTEIPQEFSDAFKALRLAHGRHEQRGQCATYWRDLQEYPVHIVRSAMTYFRQNSEDWPKTPTLRAKCYELQLREKRQPESDRKKDMSPKSKAYAREALKKFLQAWATDHYQLWLNEDPRFEELHPDITPRRFILDNWPAEGR